MTSGKLGHKSQGILEALAKGRSCEQILAADPTLTYHDIFRAAAELPEGPGNRQWSRAEREGWQHSAKSARRSVEREALTKVRD